MIIDALAGVVPEPEAFAAAEATLARLRGYQEHFSREDMQLARSWRDTEGRMASTRESARGQCPTEDDFFRMLDEAEIDKAAVYTEHYRMRLGVGTAENETVARFVAKAPGRLIGLAGVDPWEPDAAEEVDKAASDLGLQGVVVSPFKQGLDPSDGRMGRVYGRCESHGIPIFMHTGINWFVEAEYDVGHPKHIDRIACSFPDLKIVALHAGWPWVMDMMMVAWRHANVYVDISAHRPRTFAKPESGWGPLLYFGDRMVANKVVFGSAWTLLGVKPADLVAEIRELPLRTKTIEAWLGGNAARVFGLGN